MIDRDDAKRRPWHTQELERRRSLTSRVAEDDDVGRRRRDGVEHSPEVGLADDLEPDLPADHPSHYITQ